MSKSKFTCNFCKKTTDAPPCESGWGRFSDGDYYTEESTGPVCPVCAAEYLAKNCMSLDERIVLSRRLA